MKRTTIIARCIVFFYPLCATIYCGSAYGSSADVDNLIYKGEKFNAPLSIELPQDLTEGQETSYLGKIGRTSLPALPPLNGLLHRLESELKDTLCALDMIKVVEMPGLPRQGPMRYFRYTDKAPKNKILTLAMRRLVSVNYKNCYEINPMGMGKRDVCAQTFTYKLQPAINGTKLSGESFDGEAVVIKNPNTGKWGIETFKLNDPKREVLLRNMAQSLGYANGKQCMPPELQKHGAVKPDNASTERQQTTPTQYGHTTISTNKTQELVYDKFQFSLPPGAVPLSTKKCDRDLVGVISNAKIKDVRTWLCQGRYEAGETSIVFLKNTEKPSRTWGNPTWLYKVVLVDDKVRDVGRIDAVDGLALIIINNKDIEVLGLSGGDNNPTYVRYPLNNLVSPVGQSSSLQSQTPIPINKINVAGNVQTEAVGFLDSVQQGLPYVDLSAYIYSCEDRCSDYSSDSGGWTALLDSKDLFATTAENDYKPLTSIFKSIFDTKKSLSETPMGFHAAAFKNKRTGIIAIVYEGTSSILAIRDWVTNIAQANPYWRPEQYNAAIDFARVIEKRYCSNSPGCSTKIVLAGHSLGGGLAQYVAIKTGRQAYTFNAAGLWDSTAGAVDTTTAANARIYHFRSNGFKFGYRLGADFVPLTGVQFAEQTIEIPVNLPIWAWDTITLEVVIHNIERLRDAMHKIVKQG